MRVYLFVVISFQLLVKESTALSESCYYCWGTPQCSDPLDYQEVSPHYCFEDSICLKYISSSKSIESDVVDHTLTYRECFQIVTLKQDICTFVKKNEEEALSQLNYTLTDFDCTICDTTNCNSAIRNFGVYSLLIILFFTI
ncbi:hypothetical protein ABEB36_003695 [Hypothenemus hampei]|uniref:Protein quiver n=1 Tax=Hypothenemus hampei TaxID=57062 RepID=A0ABD1F3G6_HYPHA